MTRRVGLGIVTGLAVVAALLVAVVVVGPWWAGLGGAALAVALVGDTLFDRAASRGLPASRYAAVDELMVKTLAATGVIGFVALHLFAPALASTGLAVAVGVAALYLVARNPARR